MLKRTLASLAALALLALTSLPSSAQVGNNSDYPAGSIPVVAAASGTTGAVVATLAAQQGRLTYICSFWSGGVGAAVLNVNTTLGGVFAATPVYIGWNGTTAAVGFPSAKVFSPCVPASAVNTAITVTRAADAAGVDVRVEATGYTLPSP